MTALRSLAIGAILTFAAAAPALAGSPCSDRSASFDATGTHWIGIARWDDGDNNTIKLTLLADCVAEYSYDGETYTNGHWLQRGSLIEWETNDHYAVYLGEAIASSLGGVMYNKTHDHGSWVFLADK